MVFYRGAFDLRRDPLSSIPRSGQVYSMALQGAPRAIVFPKKSIGASALSGCISSRLSTKTRLFELGKMPVLLLKHGFLRRADRNLSGASDRPLREIEAGVGFWERLLPAVWSGGAENTPVGGG